MKNKFQIRKTILNFTIVPSLLVSVSMNANTCNNVKPTLQTSILNQHKEKNTKELDNNLAINVFDNNTFLDINFHSYDYNQKYLFYVDENNFANLVWKIIPFIFYNFYDFYFENFQQYENINRLFSNNQYIYICNAFENNGNDILMNLSYFVKFNSIATILIKNVSLKNAISFQKENDSDYVYPIFKFPAEFGYIEKKTLSDYKDPNVTKPVYTKKIDYENDKAFELKNYSNYKILEKSEVLIKIPNLRFAILKNDLNNLNINLPNSFQLREEDIKNNFGLFENIFPTTLTYKINKTINDDIELDIYSLNYEINTNIQNINFSYNGYLKILILKPNFIINTQTIESGTNLIDFDLNFFKKWVVIDKNYFDLISNISLNKDYLNNEANVNIKFDEKKTKKLFLYDYYKNYFNDISLKIKFDNKNKVCFNLNDFANIFIDDFDEKKLKFYFIEKPNEIINILNLKYWKNIDKNLVHVLVQLQINSENKTEKPIFEFDINNFCKYDFSNAKSYIEKNFYLGNELNKKDLLIFLDNQNNWSKLGSFSDNLTFKNVKLEDNKDFYSIDFTVNNSIGENIKNDSIKIEKKNVVLNVEKNKFNKYYLFLLILIFPILLGVWKLVKKYKKSKI